MRSEVTNDISKWRGSRLTAVLSALGVSSSSWYRRGVKHDNRKRPGPKKKPISEQVVNWVVSMAELNPWYGYKRIAVMCRRVGQAVTNRQAYRVMKKHRLLQRRVFRRAELYQTAKLFELLPSKPNELWQMDVTYIHIPGYGWWYAVTVIDYYSRYLLSAELTYGYSSREVIKAIDHARAEAERLCGKLDKTPFLVTDNGPSFISRRFVSHLKDMFRHVRIQYRTPSQLGLLERFHRTLKEEEVYWRMYDNPGHCRQCLSEFRDRYNNKRPHWSLIPAEGGDPLTPSEVYVDGRKTQIPKWQGWAKAARKKLDQMMEAAA